MNLFKLIAEKKIFNFRMKKEQVAFNKEIDHKISLEKRKMHKYYVAEHKKFLLFLDILFMIILLFNFGASGITTLLVSKNTPLEKMQLSEINPVQSFVNDYKLHSNWFSVVGMIINAIHLLTIAYWGVFTFFYVWIRRTITTDEGLYLLCCFVFMGFGSLGKDFFGNLGFLIGVLLH